MLLYLCLYWVMNFLIVFSMNVIVFKSRLRNIFVDFYTCNFDFSSIKNWKFLKSLRLNIIGSFFRISLFITSLIFVPLLLIFMSSWLSELELKLKSVSVLLMSMLMLMSVLLSVPVPVLMSVSVSTLLSESASAPVLVPVSVSVSVSVSELVSMPDWGSSTSKSHAGSLFMSVYC